MKSLKFISVEGFWEKSIHDARVAEAAEKLHVNPDAFAIATATHAPASCVSFTKLPLGKYTADKLIKEYKIAPTRILPAYLFDQKTTYTIIDAYSNAIMIGWVCSGLNKLKEIRRVELNPVTAGFCVQAERILELNKRALKALKKLNIDVIVNMPHAIMPFDELLVECPEEANKLLKLKEPGGVIETGVWKGNSGITRSFDDIDAMCAEISKTFGIVFSDKLAELSDAERAALLQKNTYSD